MDADVLNTMKYEYNAISKSCHTDTHTFFLKFLIQKSAVKRGRVKRWSQNLGENIKLPKDKWTLVKMTKSFCI